jgi:hypothetical protein
MWNEICSGIHMEDLNLELAEISEYEQFKCSLLKKHSALQAFLSRLALITFHALQLF